MTFRGAGALGLLAAMAAATPAVAGGDCYGVDLLSEGQGIQLATVAGPDARVNFVENGGKTNGLCPIADEKCRRKGFLLAGDKVLVQPSETGYLCATYKSPKGIETNGWLPKAALKIEPATQPQIADWTGRWRRDKEAEIVLEPKGPNGLLVRGAATYGALDPSRVRRGAVNVGNIDASATPRGAVIGVGEKYDGAKPPEEADPQYDCRARLRLMGPYMAVEDNGMCGGMNVRFTGIYQRETAGR
jgi:hypothetical protein